MSLQDNLAAAEAAVAYVKSLGIKAINKVSDRIAASGGIDNVVGTEQGSAALDRINKAITTGQTVTMSQFQSAGGGVSTSFLYARNGKKVGDTIRDDVARYIQERSGNCQEQAEIAALYVWDNSACRPISIMRFTEPTYDHVWVVIGLAADYDKLAPKSTLQNLRNWGDDAVWCDPWQGDGVAFPIQSLVKGAVRNLNAIYKCNTADRVAEGKPVETLRWGP
jgi:hypothetical protein